MKPKLPPFFPALLAALLLPGAALVGCKSADTANPETAPENGDAVGDGVKIVRPDSAASAEGNATGATGDADQPAEIVGTAAEEKKASKGLRLFGKKKENPKAETPAEDVAAEDAKAEESEPVAAAELPSRKRKPLFGRRSKDKDAGETAGEEDAPAPEMAAVGEKKKFRLFGFGKKKDKAAEGEPADDDAVVADNGEKSGTAGKEKEVPAVDRNPERLPWDESELELAGPAAGDSTDPGSFDGLLAPGVRADGSATGVTARIRPSDATGGIAPAPVPAPDESPLDSVPSVTDEPPITRPRDDGFVPLAPEPKFPGAEEILPPEN